MQDKQIQITYNKRESAQQNWEKAGKTLQDTLAQVYPGKPKENTKKVWEYEGYQHATQEEKENTKTNAVQNITAKNNIQHGQTTRETQ